MENLNENWYKFECYNEPSIFGYGTELEAQKYCDKLNQNREINCYTFEISKQEVNGEFWFALDDELNAEAI